jgi:4-diphosphocytidyl-2-C-methyl-D-erythritol kinase
MALRALYDVLAPAKLNLFLHVVGRREDGYHLLQSVFVPIDWCDTLHFEHRDDGALARRDLGAVLPADDLCLRAARSLQQASATRAGADISIDKRIPFGAGLGGGSSDAASTLLALNRLWGLGWSRARLADLALTLGADVPFFLGPGPAIVEGIGERLTPIAVAVQRYAVVKPPASIETRAVFQSPLLGRSAARGHADIVEGFTGGPSAGFRNDLEAAAKGAAREVAEASDWLRERFGNSRMSGSGSAVFAVVGEPGSPGQTMLPGLAPGWTGRMCLGLSAHPLNGWAE